MKFGEKNDLKSYLQPLALTVFIDEDGQPCMKNLFEKVLIDCPGIISRAEIIFHSELVFFKSTRSTPLRVHPFALKSMEASYAQRSMFDQVSVLDQTNSNDLNDLLEVYAEREFFTEMAEIITKKVQLVDPNNMALNWFSTTRSRADFEAMQRFDERYKWYFLMFKCTNNKLAVDAILRSEDALFHNCLYDFLLRNNKKDVCMGLESPLLESFLEKDHPELIWEYYLKQNHKEQAAKELLHFTSTSNLGLTQKEDNYKKVLELTNNLNIKQEVETNLAVIDIQKEALDRDTNAPILIPQEFLEFLCSKKYWDLAIRLAAYLPIQNTDRNKIIDILWSNYIYSMQNEELQTVQHRLQVLSSLLPASTDFLQPSILSPILENFRRMRNAPPSYTENTLTEMKVSTDYIL